MNTRIQELALQAADYVNTYDDVGADVWFEMYNKKFAELIVRECCLVLEQTQDALDPQKWSTPRGCTKYIKDHFGVEHE